VVCSSGIGFNPVVDGTRYTFDVYGLYNGLFIMSDRQTGSVWTHFDGSVLTGPLVEANINLEFAPLVHTTWAEWTAANPDSLVLDWYSEFADRYRDINPGRAGLGPGFERTILNWDDRLPEHELVIGVGIGETFRAYVLSDFAGGLTAVPDTLANIPIILFIDADALYGLAFVPEIDGEPITITAVNHTLTDDRGNTWGLNGTAVSGPDSGIQLHFVTSFVTEWYGWSAYHPDTSIYQE
jgi:hypothetical protein